MLLQAYSVYYICVSVAAPVSKAVEQQALTLTGGKKAKKKRGQSAQRPSPEVPSAVGVEISQVESSESSDEGELSCYMYALHIISDPWCLSLTPPYLSVFLFKSPTSFVRSPEDALYIASVLVWETLCLFPRFIWCRVAVFLLRGPY